MKRRLACWWCFACAVVTAHSTWGSATTDAATIRLDSGPVENDGVLEPLSPLDPPSRVGLLIDAFTDPQESIASAGPIARVAMSSRPLPRVLGGHRDLFVSVSGGVAEARVRSNPFGLKSGLQIDMSAGATGLVAVTWDGVAGTTGAEPDAGLSLDFTVGGLYDGVVLPLASDAAGRGEQVELRLHSSGGRVSSALVDFPVVPGVEPESTFVPFRDFLGDADVTDVTAFQMIINANLPSIDARVSLVGLGVAGTREFLVIPEPSCLRIFVLGFALAAIALRAVLRLAQPSSC